MVDALAGFPGGVTCYVKKGFLCCEWNLFEVQRTKLKSKDKLPTGKVKVDVESRLVSEISGPMDIALKVNGVLAARDRVPAAMSLLFTLNATFRSLERLGFPGLARWLRSSSLQI